MTNLLAHIRTERGPIRYEDLVNDCAAMLHCEFPRDEVSLKRQLSALVRAGLVTWVDGVVDYVPVAEERTLFS
jgi:hypothetical protein